MAASHDEFGWRLLAAADGGKLDLEALTELQIAWNDKGTAELLAGESADLALRSLWMVCEASRALPEQAELLLACRKTRVEGTAWPTGRFHVV